MAMAIKVLRPSVYLTRPLSPTSTPKFANMATPSEDSLSFENVRLHRLLESVLRERPASGPIIEQLLTTLRHAA